MKFRMNCTRTIWWMGWIHPFLQIILVQNSLRDKELNIFCPKTAATTFAFFSVFTLLLLCSLGTVVFIFCTYFTEKYCLLYCVYCIVVLRKVTFRLGRKWWTVSNIRLAGEKWEKVIVFTKILKGKNTVQRTTSPDFRHLNKAVKKLEFC